MVISSHDLSEKQVFTTGEAADICKISQQTIIRCFDRGKLKGFRVPGSRFRRIPREELVRFMRANDIPAEALARGRKRLLIVDDDEQILELFLDVFRDDERFEVKTACTGYDAGILTEQFHPDLIILDYMLPDVNGNIVCETIRGNPDISNTKIIIVSGVADQKEVGRLLKAGADAFLKKPFSIDELFSNVTNLLKI